jgi:uncharacterized protein (TIGR03437 family)
MRIVFGFLLWSAAATAQPFVISTLAGGAPGPTPVQALDLPIGNLQGVAADGAGNVYFSSLNSVFKVDPNGALTRVAGNSRPGYSGDGGPATDAQLNAFGLAVDGTGNLFIATGNRIRRVSPNGVIATVAGGGTGGLGDGGPATDAELNAYGVAVDTAGNLFVAGGSRIRKISTAGIITTVGGNGTTGTTGDGGPAANAQINGPGDVAVDRAGNIFFPDNQRVRKISISGIITTVAGNGQCCFAGDGGQAAKAQLGNPRGVAVDGAGNLYIVDAGPAHIRKVSPSGIITTVAGGGVQCNGQYGSQPLGDGGPATSALLCFGGMGRVAVDGAGNLLIADSGNQRIRKVSAGTINTVAGNGIACCFSGDGGPAAGAQLNYPWDVAVDGAGNVFIADEGNRRVRKVSPGGTINTLAGNGASCPLGPNGPSCPPADGGLATSVPLTNLWGVAADGAGNLFIADYLSGLRKVAPDGTITTVGDGPRDGVSRVTIDSSGNLYLTDDLGVRIRKISPDGTISTVAGGKLGSSGDGGPATQAELDTWDSDGPGGGLAVDGAGDVFIADTYNDRIRRVSPSGIIVTVAGGGTSDLGDGGPATNANLAEPFSVASDSAGNLFIADSYNNLIRKVSPDGNITTIAGNGSSGYSGDGGSATSAALSGPTGVAVDGAGNIYVADNGNNAVRVLRPANHPAIGAVVDAAGQRAAPLAPGKIVVIYGVALGPSTLVQGQPNNGQFSTQLGGTSVSFNGALAPILYTSETQVAVTAPSAINGAMAQVTMTYQGQASTPFTVSVALSSPSLFTLNQTGGGQAAAVNADGSINTAANPVRVGDYISLYATGGGNSNLPVSVTIGGFPAAVQYAGSALGQPAGLMQVNVQIPSGVQPGGYVPVVLKVGDTSTTDGAVWIAVSAQ